ncbi:ras guanine nucleotide exchange factor domain-containing protein [Mycena metata]|uniref:Ras guanine nucleotide exchange factor domain-containing protein n=1 Tax=Mycena metata TaxID=1033252 RepID=A0AAD7ILN1_9AGAR|nr:ras guanine nucleotide exchange factor domain-containing protein [Mycena metata]
MSADLIIGTLSLAKDVAGLIRNGPQAQREVADLNNRLIARLNSLTDPSMALDDRTVADFVTEAENVIKGIRDKVERRGALHVVTAVFRQDEILSWVAQQNRKLDETFRLMIIQILVANVRQITETRARQEHDLAAIRSEMNSQFERIITHFQSEPSLDGGVIGEALHLVATQPAPHTPPSLPPISPAEALSLDGFLPSSPQQSIAGESYRTDRQPASLSPISLAESLSSHGLLPSPEEPRIAQEPASHPPVLAPILATTSIYKRENNKIYGNPRGLIDFLLMTDDENFKRLILKTYRDYTTPEELFDVTEQAFAEARPETDALHFIARRAKILNVIVPWLETLPPDSQLVHRVRQFASGNLCAVVPDHKTRILQAIMNRRPLLVLIGSSTAEPHYPEELALALTHRERDLHKTIEWIDYLLYIRGQPSRLDDWVSNHRKMIRWVRYSVLRHDEMKDRAEAMKRFAKTGKECLRRQNYNSVAAIAQALDLTAKPIRDLSHTLKLLSRKTRATFENLTKKIDSDQDYEAYRKTVKKLRSGNYIPWCTAELHYLKARLAQYPPTVDGLINFERYEQLARMVPVYEVPPGLEGNREEHHIAYLFQKFDNEGYDEEAENRRRRWLITREEDDYRTRRPQWDSLGVKSRGGPSAHPTTRTPT